jgi:hypothetical protein
MPVGLNRLQHEQLLVSAGSSKIDFQNRKYSRNFITDETLNHFN